MAIHISSIKLSKRLRRNDSAKGSVRVKNVYIKDKVTKLKFTIKTPPTVTVSAKPKGPYGRNCIVDVGEIDELYQFRCVDVKLFQLSPVRLDHLVHNETLTVSSRYLGRLGDSSLRGIFGAIF